MATVGKCRCFWGALFFCGIMMTGSRAQTFTTLTQLDGSALNTPEGLLAQGTDGSLYGITALGGTGCSPNGCGTVFEITPSGVFTVVYSFCPLIKKCKNGNPQAGLSLASDGNFYGTTPGGVFRFTPNGSFGELLFHGLDDFISAPVVQGTDGNLYGTNRQGGPKSAGSIFKVSPPGVMTSLYNFCSQPNCTDGEAPYSGLVQASDGNFYGTTFQGGAYGFGTIFRISAQGSFATVHSFCSESNCADGIGSASPLIQGTDGNLYGTTNGNSGTAFKLTPAGELTTLYTFCSQPSCEDGSNPGLAGLVQATDGNFYGTTVEGGNPVCMRSPFYGCGTVYKITPSGNLTTLYSFDGSDGSGPEFGVMQATNGTFYGTTSDPTNNGSSGIIFNLSTGLDPFVAFVVRAAKIGQTAEVLGQGFTSATEVSFNGVAASFKVRSDTFLTATVPSGATTGYVTVTTPSGILTSNVPFRVIQ
jgi:uncharacterized repeat protein (TIGR03803 family)